MFTVAWAGRTTRSTCLCVLEAVLAAIVFAYTALDLLLSAKIGYSDHDDGGFVLKAFLYAAFVPLLLVNGVFGIVLFTTGCATRTGVAHSLGRSNPQGAPSPGDADRVERDRLAESLERDGVDLFDFDEFATTSMSILLGISSLFLSQLVEVVFIYPYAIYVVLSTFSFGNSGGSGNVAIWLVLIVLALLTFRRLFYRFRFVEKFRKLEQSCRTQPSCNLVRTVLILSSIAYGIVLYHSPAPSVLRWSLIVTHAVRALKLVISLRDQREGMEAATDVSRDIL